MTGLLDTDPEALEESAAGTEAEVSIPEGWRRCAKTWADGRECETYFDGANKQQKYCPEHQPQKKRPATDGQPRPKSVTNNIKVELGAPKKAKATDTVAERVEAGATAMLSLVPVLFAAIGDEQCGAVFTRQVPAIAHQLGEIARYHPALEKIFNGAEGTGELFAWVGLFAVTLPALIAVLLHHGVVKGALAQRLEAIAKTLEGAGGSAD